MVRGSASLPAAVQLALSERDLVLAVLEFLDTRKHHISQVSLERETGLINGDFSEDVLFLRQLIIDGQWDNALDFVEPLKESDEFDQRAFSYLITKYKFFELLCIKQEPGPMHDNDFAVEELVEVLKNLEQICPTPEDYRHLCALLTLPKLSDHADFRSWNPSAARVECFHKVYPLIGGILNKITPKKDEHGHATNDRLTQLVAKGIFYEACVDFCQAQAINNKKAIEAGPQFSQLLSQRPKLSAADLSLVSWLEVLSNEQFTLPFQQRALEFKFEPMKKPKLEAQWTEQIMATPIKPGGQFPHALVPKARLKFAEKMSQSMIVMPQMSFSMAVEPGHALNAEPSKRVSQAMSQSTAPGLGFCIQREPANDNLMEQSLVIQNMMEQSEMTKQSRPQALFPKDSASTPAASGPELTQSRRELDQIARHHQGPQSAAPARSQAASMLPTVPELPTPGGVSPSESCESRLNAGPPDAMTTSRLFREFSSKRQPVPRPLSVHSLNMAPSAGPLLEPGYAPHQPLQPRPLSTVYPAPAFYDPALAYPRPSHIPTPRPQSYVPSAYRAPPTAQPRPTPPGMSVQFIPVCRYEDSQAIRAVSFHPTGRYFAVGTNSKQLLVCKYPDLNTVNWSQVPVVPDVSLLRPKQHRGSVYCCGFNLTGDLLASGSNDKTLRLMSFNAEKCTVGAEMELTMHDGTVRDLIFMEEGGQRTLVSGGAGNCHICLTDCATGRTYRNLSGHSGPILGLYSWASGPCFTSCSQDKTIRFWDVRAPTSISVIQPNVKTSSSPVTSVCVDPSGKLLVSGHEDASIMLFDVIGGRAIQTFRPHGDEVRTVRFSNAAYYLLSGSYDKRAVITDMRGDLTSPLMYLPVAEHNDKIIQCRWHPHEFTFLSTSADRTAVLWTLPPNQRP